MINNAKKRKICFVITSRIHYARQKLLLDLLDKHPGIELQLIVGGSALLSKYSDTISQIEKDNFNINEKLYMIIEGGDNIAMAKTTGLAVLEFTNALQKLEPDIVVIRGDRFEMLAAAIAAAYLNRTIAHIEGGDVTGTIDESVRHAITKLSHIHFVSNEDSYKKVIQMGENPKYVFNVGSPDIEHTIIFGNNGSEEKVFESINKRGTGQKINFAKKFIIIIQHPVTTESNHKIAIEETLQAVYSLNIPTIWFWPNVDAGTDEVSKTIRKFRENFNPQNIHFIRDVPPEDFIILLKKSACLVGNSSAGIKESSYLGVPVVNIGTRQNQRLRAENVIDVGYNRAEIKEAILKQIHHGPYPSSDIYYKADTNKNIVDILSKIELYIQKIFYSL